MKPLSVHLESVRFYGSAIMGSLESESFDT